MDPVQLTLSLRNALFVFLFAVTKILVVDDSPTQLLLMTGALQSEDAEVLRATNGVEALQVIKDQSPDLVVTDMQMPEMNGVDLIREMRKACPLTPSILVTAYGSEELAAEALGMGAANYIAKDHVGAMLADTARRLLRLSAANAQALNLKGALRRTRFDFAIDGVLDRIEPLASLVVQLLASMNALRSSDRVRIAETLNYVFFHSILHGNLEVPVRDTPISAQEAAELIAELEKDESAAAKLQRIVSFRMDVNDRRVRFDVSHEGSSQYIHKAPLPGTPESFVSERGRGMMLLTSVMDEVRIDANHYGLILVKFL